MRTQGPSHPFSKEQRIASLLSTEEGVGPAFVLYAEGGILLPISWQWSETYRSGESSWGCSGLALSTTSVGA